MLPFIQTSIILKNGRGALSSLKNDFVEMSYRARVLTVDLIRSGEQPGWETVALPGSGGATSIPGERGAATDGMTCLPGWPEEPEIID